MFGGTDATNINASTSDRLKNPHLASLTPRPVKIIKNRLPAKCQNQNVQLPIELHLPLRW